MLFNTNAKKTLKSINYPLVAQLMSQFPGEERKKTANVSIFCNTYTTLYVIQYITQYNYKKTNIMNYPLAAQLMSQVPGEEWKKPQIYVAKRTNTKP